MVFMDTASLYFEGADGQTMYRHGYNKDRRLDLRKMILAVLLEAMGDRCARRCGRTIPPT
jgi:hypothetical protein